MVIGDILPRVIWGIDVEEIHVTDRFRRFDRIHEMRLGRVGSFDGDLRNYSNDRRAFGCHFFMYDAYTPAVLATLSAPSMIAANNK